jgi:hypothetical protein
MTGRLHGRKGSGSKPTIAIPNGTKIKGVTNPDTDLSDADFRMSEARVYHIGELSWKRALRVRCTSMKSPSTPTAAQVLAIAGIISRSPPLATPPPSSCTKRNAPSKLLLSPYVLRDCFVSVAAASFVTDRV